MVKIPCCPGGGNAVNAESLRRLRDRTVEVRICRSLDYAEPIFKTGLDECLDRASRGWTYNWIEVPKYDDLGVEGNGALEKHLEHMFTRLGFRCVWDRTFEKHNLKVSWRKRTWREWFFGVD